VKHMMDLKYRDLKQLSAYLDGELNPKESSRLELRLKDNPQLQQALGELDRTRRLINSLPQIRPPRNFTLTPEMVGIKQKHNFYPVFRFATVVAAVAFAVLVGTDTFLRSGTGRMLAADQMVEVTHEVQVEKLAQAPPLEDSPVMEAAEPAVEAPQEALGAEKPLASMAEDTETFEAEGEGISVTEEAANRVELLPSGTPMPPSDVLPVPTPTLEEWRGPTETQPAVPTRQPTSPPVIAAEPEVPKSSVEPMRAAEVGLGVLAVILGAVTFILRRQH
jgi:hypothetical protein